VSQVTSGCRVTDRVIEVSRDLKLACNVPATGQLYVSKSGRSNSELLRYDDVVSGAARRMVCLAVLAFIASKVARV
jgi:hypothetical protein